MKKVHFVKIEWFDSVQENQPWHWIEEYIANLGLRKDEMISCGFLIHKNKDVTVLASAIRIVEGKIEKMAGVYQIPTGCIKKISKLD